LIVDESTLRAPAQMAGDIAVLTAGLARGDETAFRQFYDLYFNRLLAYLLVLTANEDTAREALQLTLVRVVRYAKRFDSEPAFWSWLTVLARSAVADERRRSNRYWALLGRFFSHEQSNAAATADDAPDRLMQLLEAKLGDLPDDERDLLRRKYIAEESVREIAGNYATTEKTIESRLSRVRRRLKDLILAQLKNEL
jgi:RNA polymerase sigma-70 factor (ECF subfamily)